METNPNLIVMLTHNDFTVGNAAEIFEECKKSEVKYWGMKEQGLPLDEMKRLCQHMKECGKTTILEVVAYTQEEGLVGAKTAVECGFDILMGTIFSDAINEYCATNGLKYMPFVGTVTERPSILSGNIDDIVNEAKRYVEKGVYGIDLLGYRYVGDIEALNEALVKNINAPVCIAGSINTYTKLDSMKMLKPWAFTIGSAFFDNCFGDSIAQQIDNVCRHLKSTPAKRKKLFCEISPFTYAISLKKEILKRHIKNIISSETFASTISSDKLPTIVYQSHNDMIKRGPGIDPKHQLNKAENIRLACSKINGLIIKPGETFSFWKRVGKTSKRNGFTEGRVIVNGRLKAGLGGGLCNLANTINLLVLNSPMTITEIHHHSDALAPDPNGVRVPYSAGTSVNYNFIDYRFRNDTDQPVQLCTWCEGDFLYTELRTTQQFPCTYRIVEEGHHFHKEHDGNYYRISKIYRETINRDTSEITERKLIWNNHSRVMFDPNLIPNELIR